MNPQPDPRGADGSGVGDSGDPRRRSSGPPAAGPVDCPHDDGGGRCRRGRVPRRERVSAGRCRPVGRHRTFSSEQDADRQPGLDAGQHTGQDDADRHERSAALPKNDDQRGEDHHDGDGSPRAAHSRRPGDGVRGAPSVLCREPVTSGVARPDMGADQKPEHDSRAEQPQTHPQNSGATPRAIRHIATVDRSWDGASECAWSAQRSLSDLSRQAARP